MRWIVFMLLGFSLFGGVFGCMPHTPHDVIIGKFGGISTGYDVQWMGDVGVFMYNVDFPFFADEIQSSFRPKRRSIGSGVALPDLGDVIVMLASYHDGSYPHDYTIDSYAILSCEDGVLQLGSTYGYHLARNRDEGACHAHPVHILDGFIDGDGDQRLQKLHKRYPDCDVFDHTFRSLGQKKQEKEILTWREKVLSWFYRIF